MAEDKPNPRFHFAKPLVQRQHALIEELRACSPPYVRGAQLAERTATTIRTVERDLARLIQAGVPLDRKHGPGGGYRLDSPGTLNRPQRQIEPIASCVAGRLITESD